MGGTFGVEASEQRRRGRALISWMCLAAAFAFTSAPAQTSGTTSRITEFEPEFDGYIKLSEQARLFLLADATYATPSHDIVGQAGIHLDYTLKPIVRASLREADWERNRYLWTRVGYQRFDNLTGDADAASENRVILEATARSELRDDVWLVNRLRIDLRDVGGTRSNRFRYRIGVEKQLSTSSGRAFIPYAQAEWYYDTRYDAWSRQVYQAGVEIELDKSWRLEPYYAYQKDTQPTPAVVNRVGLVLKYYR